MPAMENKRKASGGDIKQSRDTKNRRRYVQHLRGTKQPHDGAQHSHEDLRRWHKKHFLESFVLRTNLYPDAFFGPLDTVENMDLTFLCRSFAWAKSFSTFVMLRYHNVGKEGQATLRAWALHLPDLPDHRCNTLMDLSAVVTLSISSSLPNPMYTLIPADLTIIALCPL
ncbi:uncharacterized protein CcaverHIS019_0300880 [Cutaneotrichosporon cavernicola]|uniref:Uncharacterized protein n=1 Tax=Cutaneotrichosporon cavernicola TaxID=279322 RepID=A0AA48IIU5_9TREE|nr:uncharacterized protein CcaverHIS019_0300880 [Cutaneotrichosporon cavernicola]BEI90018.1 hypothetical protein CcaverHIS019_0300880 [Cutaneotrichosporon cavernicola]